MTHYLGWYDPDKKRPAVAKLAHAVAQYVQKFPNDPTVCLTSPEDAAEILADPRWPENEHFAIRSADYIPRHTYYIGREDEG
jgi:hypothetical protein